MLDDTLPDDERVSTPRVLDSTLAEGVQLGYFRIERKLGSGGMGDVYLATDLALDRLVAVKVLSGAAADREHLVREARAQARVHHPNVAHIYYVGESHDRQYFAMEYVRGRSLAEKLGVGALPVQEALEIVRAIALGLREADRAGIVHRDIKPSNVMIDEDGVVKILDFGLATGGMTSAGTPYYLAPERAAGARGDARSDIYSLGVTAYQMLTGQLPFSASSPTELATKHAHAPRPRVDIDGVGELLDRMMAIEPADRVGSYDELIEQLDVLTERARPVGAIVRTVAAVIDLVLIIMLQSLVSVAAGGPDESVFVLELLMYAAVSALLLPRFGRTPGKALLDLELVRKHDLSRIPTTTALARGLAVVALPILVWLACVGLTRMGVLTFADGDLVGRVAGAFVAVATLGLASLRRTDRRVWWDRAFGTLVRFRPRPRPPRVEEVAIATTPVETVRVVRAAPSRIEKSPRRLDHFVFEQRLGAGGMGEVFLATDVSLRRRVAIKLLLDGTTSPRAREWLVREARAQARLQHPNVAHIYFVGEDAGHLYFAMEYIAGGSLAERMASGPISVDEALTMVREAALGLREAHRAGFLHRDVKPSNLMLDAQQRVKVVDFGLVTDAPKPSEAPITSTSAAGTPLYMAPEQARNEPLDQRADIYALGATLYHLVTGRPPFEADTTETLHQLHAAAPRPSVARGGTHDEVLDALIGKMMAPLPADRFASYDELLAAIDRVARLHARPASMGARAAATMTDVVVVLTLAVAAEEQLEATYGYEIFRLPFVPLMLYQAVAVARFGTTLGKWLFGMEVADLDTLGRPSLRTAMLRALIAWGPLSFVQGVVALAWFIDEDLYMPVPARLGTLAVAAILALLFLGARAVPGRRTLWDRHANTLVRHSVRRRK